MIPNTCHSDDVVSISPVFLFHVQQGDIVDHMSSYAVRQKNGFPQLSFI